MAPSLYAVNMDSHVLRWAGLEPVFSFGGFSACAAGSCGPGPCLLNCIGPAWLVAVRNASSAFTFLSSSSLAIMKSYLACQCTLTVSSSMELMISV